MPTREELDGQLMEAAKTGDAAEVRRLLDLGANVSAKDEDDMTPLMWAAHMGNADAVRLLLGAPGQKVDARDDEKRTALMWAARLDLVEEAKILKAAGMDGDALSERGWRLMKTLAKRRHRAVTRLLLEAGANTRAKDKDGWTALMFAAWQGDCPGPAETLLAAGADANARARDGRTPLMGAAHRCYVGMVKLLAAKGADVNARAADGWTALLEAVDHRDSPATVKALLEVGADVNAQADDGFTALSLAARLDHWRAFKTLLAAPGVNVNAAIKEIDTRQYNGWTALMFAAESGPKKRVAELLARGAEVNATDRDGKTALMIAVEAGNMDTARVLVKAGADVDYAADMLRRKGHGPEVLGRLFALGAYAPKKGKLAACCRAALKRLAKAKTPEEETAALKAALIAGRP